MSFNESLKSGGKLGGAAFAAYFLNRFASTMEYSKTIMKDSPETGAVIVSSGITLGIIKFQEKVKDKLVRAGLVGGSVAATIHLATRIPTIQKALPAGVVAALAGDDEYEEISGEEAENQINAEVDARLQKAFKEGKIQFIEPNSQLALPAAGQTVYQVGNDNVYEIDGGEDYPMSGVYNL